LANYIRLIFFGETLSKVIFSCMAGYQHLTNIKFDERSTTNQCLSQQHSAEQQQ
jgi:hypothetical protein